MIEETGASTGGATSGGSVDCASCSFSLTTWRA
jgi:hypothetical protein